MTIALLSSCTRPNKLAMCYSLDTDSWCIKSSAPLPPGGPSPKIPHTHRRQLTCTTRTSPSASTMSPDSLSPSLFTRRYALVLADGRPMLVLHKEARQTDSWVMGTVHTHMYMMHSISYVFNTLPLLQCPAPEYGSWQKTSIHAPSNKPNPSCPSDRDICCGWTITTTPPPPCSGLT